MLALLYAYKKCEGIDPTVVNLLEHKYNDKLQNGHGNDFYYASLYLFLIQDFNESLEMLDIVLRKNPQHESARVLTIWVDLFRKNVQNSNTLHIIESILQKSNNLDVWFAQIRYFQLRRQYDNALMTINKISIRLPESNVPLIEKMKTFLVEMNWDQAYETCHRILNLGPTNISANIIKTYLVFAKDGNQISRFNTLQHLFRVIDKVELGNIKLILEVCQIFSRICSRDLQVVNIIFRYMENVSHLNSKIVAYLTELGNLKLMQGDTNTARKFFQTAINIDGTAIKAMCGLTLCLLLDNDHRIQIQQNIDLLHKIDGIEQVPMFLFLKSKLSDNRNSAISLLNSAIEMHMKKLDNTIFCEDYINILNPDFLLQVVQELLIHSPVECHIHLESREIIEKNHIIIKLSSTVLEAILSVCPLNVQALFHRAKIQFLCGDIGLAIKLLHQIFEIESTCIDACFLMSLIYLQQNQFAKAIQSLESALTHNFSIRQIPTYYLLLGISQSKQKNYGDAKKSFVTALQLDENNTFQPQNMSSTYKLSGIDKVTLYLEYAACLRQSGELNSIYESETLLQTALEEFHDTSEEGRLLIAKADAYILNYDINNAIRLLDDIQSNQPYFIKIKTHLANIYLKHKKNRNAFIKCFETVVDICQDAESYLMLGDAFMSIQESQQAINAFKNAISIQPNDTTIASKLGRAYIKTHQYKKAVDFFVEALENPIHSDLRLDLAELYMKLKTYEKGVELLVNNYDNENLEEKDITSLRFQTKKILLLSRMYEKFGDYSKSLDTLNEAKKIQLIIKKRSEMGNFINSIEQNNILTKIYLLIAEQSIHQKDFEQALYGFKEALKISPTNIYGLTSLARLQLQMNSNEQCRETCSRILDIDKYNEAASVMMAEISFRKMEFDGAAYHFSQLLLASPCNFTALARLIEVLRRSGSLSDISLFMQKAMESVTNGNQSAGINYCKGLIEWYSGNPNNALKHFNSTRHDSEWGQQSISNMIEICINPDGEFPNLNDSVDTELDNSELLESRRIALRTAERLLKDLRPRENMFGNEILNHRLLQYFLLLSTKQKFHVERALEKFYELSELQGYDKMVGPILGIASSMVLLKQVHRAKNILKRVVNVPWNTEEAEYFERSLLLLANIYVGSNKLDIAKDLAQKALHYNKSSFKAYELLGYISERAQLLKEAATFYKNAWDFSGKRKPHIGYKLAHILMKSKEFPNAIAVCHQMLRLYPDNMSIRKDILEKCRNNLRQ